jgi:hypothetical protein
MLKNMKHTFDLTTILTNNKYKSFKLNVFLHREFYFKCSNLLIYTPKDIKLSHINCDQNDLNNFNKSNIFFDFDNFDDFISFDDFNDFNDFDDFDDFDELNKNYKLKKKSPIEIPISQREIIFPKNRMFATYKYLFSNIELEQDTTLIISGYNDFEEMKFEFYSPLNIYDRYKFTITKENNLLE